MLEKEEEIINDIDKLEEVKKIKDLIKKIEKNEEYNSLMNEFNKNKEKYIKDNILKEKVIELREKLYLIDEVKEYTKLLTDIRLLSINISKEISSILPNDNCLH